jgi:type II secretory pathway component PulF
MSNASVGYTGQSAFKYRAAQPDGTLLNGTMLAADERTAVDALHARGLYPIEVSLARFKSSRSAPRASDVAPGLRVLANLLAADIPMSRTLATFEELAPKSWAAAAAAIRERVRTGGRLADGLRDDAGLSPVLAGIIAAGESSGDLAPAVLRSAELAEENASLRSAVRGALVYPAILLVAGACSVGLLVGVVLPRFATILADTGQEPPPLTQLVLHVTAAIQHNAISGAILAILGVVGWRIWTRTANGGVIWNALLLRFPGVGGIRRSAATSRVCTAMAALLDSGVPAAVSLGRAATAAGDAAIESRLATARAGVTRGESLGLALEESSALTIAAVRLVRAGEESGRVSAMFLHAARIEGERARELTRGAVRLVEPSLILVFGALVALIAGALLQAVVFTSPTQIQYSYSSRQPPRAPLTVSLVRSTCRATPQAPIRSR